MTLVCDETLSLSSGLWEIHCKLTRTLKFMNTDLIINHSDQTGTLRRV